MEDIYDLIENKKPIPKELVEFIKITGDGNFLFLTFSYNLY